MLDHVDIPFSDVARPRDLSAAVLRPLGTGEMTAVTAKQNG